jgi:DNA-binding transcriptional regulator YhcF (GntR family)
MTKTFEKIIEKIVDKTISKNKTYNPDEFITRKELAKRWNVHVDTIAKMHDRELYPTTIVYYKFGKANSYKWADCLKFADLHFRLND